MNRSVTVSLRVLIFGTALLLPVVACAVLATVLLVRDGESAAGPDSLISWAGQATTVLDTETKRFNEMQAALLVLEGDTKTHCWPWGPEGSCARELSSFAAYDAAAHVWESDTIRLFGELVGSAPTAETRILAVRVRRAILLYGRQQAATILGTPSELLGLSGESLRTRINTIINERESALAEMRGYISTQAID